MILCLLSHLFLTFDHKFIPLFMFSLNDYPFIMSYVGTIMKNIPCRKKMKKEWETASFAVYLFQIVKRLFCLFLFQFIWAKSVNKHIYWGNVICHTHCHFRSRFVCTFDWEHAGMFGIASSFFPFSPHISNFFL